VAALGGSDDMEVGGTPPHVAAHPRGEGLGSKGGKEGGACGGGGDDADEVVAEEWRVPRADVPPPANQASPVNAPMTSAWQPLPRRCRCHRRCHAAATAATAATDAAATVAATVAATAATPLPRRCHGSHSCDADAMATMPPPWLTLNVPRESCRRKIGPTRVVNDAQQSI
jgi:hypothetical protein